MVTKGGELKIIPKYADGLLDREVSHAVASGGESVLAAGEAEIAGLEGDYHLLDINQYSGHYFRDVPFDDKALELARSAFRQAGVTVP